MSSMTLKQNKCHIKIVLFFQIESKYSSFVMILRTYSIIPTLTSIIIFYLITLLFFHYFYGWQANP